MTRALRLVLPLLCVALFGCADRQAPAPATGSTGDAAARIRAALPRFRAATPPGRSAPALADARALLQAGRREDARAALEAELPRDPTGEAAFLLGWLHLDAQRYALALPLFERALERGPVFPKARRIFYLYARCLQETGDLAGGRAGYEADDLLFPTEPDAAYRLALLDFEEGDLASCEARARASLERFERPRDVAKAYALLADVLLVRDELGEARGALERCVELFPHYEAYYKLSRACARLGDEEAAERYLAEHRLWRARAGR
jgi:tetratricopeptide (TPR) repeat protein